MHSAFRLATKFLKYFITASNGKGHGIHSPFVFHFVTKILNDKKKYGDFAGIEKIRNQLIQDQRILNIEDFGAGSVTKATSKRPVKNIARSALKPAKYAQLLYRIVHSYQPNTIVELGTSFGITTAYLAKANPAGKVFTMEGAQEVASVAKETFDQLQLSNVELTTGNFDETLSSVLNKLPVVDFAFVDGNHRKEPTLQYFHQLLEKHSDQSVFIFDDIHWSDDMEAAWQEIKDHPAVTLSIDLFFIGLIFFRKENKVKQHFTIRF